MSPILQGPRVAVPPPLFFVAGWGAAWGLGRRLPFEIDGRGASAVQEVLGAGLVVMSLALAAWAAATFVRARTPIVPIREARAIVTEGPYRFSRNPMYAGLTGLYLGPALLLNQAWPFVMLPVVLGVVSVFVIGREERYLRTVFHQQYEAYCRRVRRWL